MLAFLTRLSPGDLPDAGEAGCVLGGAVLGQLDSDVVPAWPEQRIFAPLEGSTATSLREIWHSAVPYTAGNSEGIAWSRAGGILYGVIELDEAAFSGVGERSPLQAASQGLVCLHPLFAAGGPVPSGRPPAALTGREREVLVSLAAGLGNKEIAAQLGVSEHTVKFHLSSIFSKLDVATRTEAVTAGLRQGLVML